MKFGSKCSQDSRIVCIFQFSCRFAFYQLFVFWDTVYMSVQFSSVHFCRFGTFVYTHTFRRHLRQFNFSFYQHTDRDRRRYLQLTRYVNYLLTYLLVTFKFYLLK